MVSPLLATEQIKTAQISKMMLLHLHEDILIQIHPNGIRPNSWVFPSSSISILRIHYFPMVSRSLEEMMDGSKPHNDGLCQRRNEALYSNYQRYRIIRPI